MPKLTVTFRGHVYSHQQMEGLIRALLAAGYDVDQESSWLTGHACTISDGRAPNKATGPSRWKALAAAVSQIETH